jgi:dihydrofolate synthase/folylpolyglutamate synthase
MTGAPAARKTPGLGALEWLDAAQGRGIVPGLGRMERLLAGIGNPERSLRCLHVAGTNGKGSVCAFAESVLGVSGMLTGLYTSPHLVRFAERIRIGGREAEESQIAEGVGRLQQATEGWPEREMPTYFELVTALAFDLFARAGVDAVVLETGLGGRLDATNAAPKLACAITPIGLDHTEWLGNSLDAIAREKAGIFRAGIPAVSAPQEPEALIALRESADALGVVLQVIGEQVPEKWSLGLAGAHQRWNAALALALLKAGGFSPSEEMIAKGLAGVFWPGRFQWLMHRGRELILDGAHNLHAALCLAAAWRARYGERRCTLVFGALADKDPGSILAALAPISRAIVLVPVDSPRTEDPRRLAAGITGYSGVVHTAGSLREVLVDGVNGVTGAVPASEGPVLVTGSLFLVGEALSVLSGGKSTPRTQ